MTIIELSDGRSLDVDVSGPEDGMPLVFHHGTPGSVRQFRAIQRAALQHGVLLMDVFLANPHKLQSLAIVCDPHCIWDDGFDLDGRDLDGFDLGDAS